MYFEVKALKDNTFKSYQINCEKNSHWKMCLTLIDNPVGGSEERSGHDLQTNPDLEDKSGATESRSISR